MSKGLIVGAVVLLVVVLAGGAYYMMGRSSTPEDTESTSEETAQNSETNSSSGSLKSLLSLGSNQQCRFTDAESQSEGTIYVAGEQARGDFESEVEGETMLAHTIVDNGMVYLWFDGSTEGFKMAMSDTEQGDESSDSGVDLDREVDYECSSWSVDDSVFQLPSGVEFRDFSALLNIGEEIEVGADADVDFDQCAACEALPSEAKSQCLSALNCE